MNREPGWYCGDSHVHSTCSDGYGTIPELLHVARAAGLDWIAITDHANRSYRDTCPEGMRQVRALPRCAPVVGIPGLETGCANPSNHLNVINARRFVHPERIHRDPETGRTSYAVKNPGEILREIRAQDFDREPVLCVVNHPMNADCEAGRLLGRATRSFPPWKSHLGTTARGSKTVSSGSGSDS